MIVARRSRSQYLFAAIALSFASLHCVAQTPATSVPRPTPPGEAQEPVRVFTEEVLIPVFVRDSKGHFDPTLEADDLLVFEDDVSQQIRSLRRVPSSVLLLLDTSGELNPAMNTNTTREIAINLIKTITRRTPLVKVTNKKRKSAKDIADELMNPTAPWDEIRRRKIYVIIDTDLSMRNRRKDYKEATKESERWLGDLADETGGLMLLPGSSAEMLRQGEMIAHEINTQYVVAYAPKISLATAADGEYRRIKVAARRGGLEVRTRRGYVATSR